MQNSPKQQPAAIRRIPAHHSSLSDEWITPQEFFARLDAEFGFELDVAARPTNAKTRRFFSLQENGLAQEWRGVVWCNPPYTRRQIGLWVRKAYESALAGATVACLIPARTRIRYWHEYVMRAAEVRFVRGRLRFSDSKSAAPFPSAVVVSCPPQPSFSGTPRRGGPVVTGSQLSLFSQER